MVSSGRPKTKPQMRWLDQQALTCHGAGGWKAKVRMGSREGSVPRSPLGRSLSLSFRRLPPHRALLRVGGRPPLVRMPIPSQAPSPRPPTGLLPPSQGRWVWGDSDFQSITEGSPSLG